jgi:S1-C subfamily serine protease
VVGVNTAIGTDGERYNMGVAFTIPSNMAVRVARQLIAHGEVARGWLGISLADLTDEDVELFGLKNRHGVMVDVLYEDSPAREAGLRCEDIIVSVNDTEARDMRALQAAVADISPGEAARLKVLRDGDERDFDVRLDKQPEDINAWVRAARAVKSREVKSLALHVRTMREELPVTLVRRPGSDVALADRALQHRGERGVLVTEFAAEDSDASTSTLTPGELIISCNDRPVASVATLQSAIEATERTRRVKLTVLTPEGKRRIVRLPRE